VTFLGPASNAFVRQTITVETQAADSGTGVATFGLSVDGQALTATLTPPLPPPAAAVTATAALTTTPLPDGIHTLGAAATDQAGNPASARRVVIVDNTPPDTQIVSGPSSEILETSATFSFTGSDNLTPVGSFQFARQLDSAAFTPFMPATTGELHRPSRGPAHLRGEGAGPRGQRGSRARDADLHSEARAHGRGSGERRHRHPCRVGAAACAEPCAERAAV